VYLSYVYRNEAPPNLKLKKAPMTGLSFRVQRREHAERAGMLLKSPSNYGMVEI